MKQKAPFAKGAFCFSALSHPVRLAGVQVSRNFGLRHDLITTPISTIAGSASVPSTIDIYVNSARAYSGQVENGPFEVANLPVMSGPGSVRVVLRDALGRETVTTSSYYMSPTLLAPGLSDFSMEAGFPRRSYSLKSNDYSGDPFLIGSIRYGLNDRLTLEGHGEFGQELLNAGAGMSFGLEDLGTASLSLAGSRHDPETCSPALTDCGIAYGLQLGAQAEMAMADWRIYARTLRIFGDYADVASVTSTQSFDELGYYPYFYAPIVSVDQLSVSVPLGFDPSHVNVNFTHSVDSADESRLILGVSHSRPAWWGGTFAVSAYHDFENTDNSGIFAGLYFTLGNNVSLATGVSGRGDDLGFSASMTKPETAEIGSYGWRIRTQEGGTPYRSAAASYRAEIMRVEAGISERSGSTQFQAQADGAIATLGGDVFFANRIDDSFAVVDAAAPDIKVFHENRPIGVTGENGRLLVPSLRSWQPNIISIDPANLPINADIIETKQQVTPAAKSGVLVKFDAKAANDAALVEFRLADRTPVPVSSEGFIEGQPESFVIGYDGQAYIRGLERQNIVTIIQPGGKRCVADFEFMPKPGEQVHIEDVLCN
ncbi:MAG TPA: fimbria/pilus outer membrane usher protein [Hyphomicrobiales bacterium]|nr:fimbria/pilus outer membrane usher protein [Hyphomicrobiales bacterium]